MVKIGSIVYRKSNSEMLTVKGIKAKTNELRVENAKEQREWISADDIQMRPKILKVQAQHGKPFVVENPTHETLEAFASSDAVEKVAADEFVIKDVDGFIKEIEKIK